MAKNTQQNITKGINLFSIETFLANHAQEQLKEDVKEDQPKQENSSYNDERWGNYVAFIEGLKRNLQDSQRDSITRYWQNCEEENNPSNATMKWVDPVALENAKKAMESDKEKRNSKCLNNVVMKKTPLYPEDLSVFDILDKELPNFKEVTAFYRGSFALNQSRGIDKFEAPRPVLLLGNPGIGKTHYAKKLASLLKTSYRFFDANSINGGWVLSGNNATWKGADAGLIFKEMAKSETISPIILLDEIDKISSTKEHSPFSILHQLFEKENARKFYDEFVDVEFDASQVIYIMTANDASTIAPSLLSRMNVFHIENPDEASMAKISQDIYKTALGGSAMFKKTLAKSEVEKLVKFTPREVTQIISANLFSQASETVKVKTAATAKSLTIDIKQKSSKKAIGF